MLIRLLSGIETKRSVAPAYATKNGILHRATFPLIQTVQPITYLPVRLPQEEIWQPSGPETLITPSFRLRRTGDAMTRSCATPEQEILVSYPDPLSALVGPSKFTLGSGAQIPSDVRRYRRFSGLEVVSRARKLLCLIFATSRVADCDGAAGMRFPGITT